MSLNPCRFLFVSVVRWTHERLSLRSISDTVFPSDCYAPLNFHLILRGGDRRLEITLILNPLFRRVLEIRHDNGVAIARGGWKNHPDRSLINERGIGRAWRTRNDARVLFYFIFFFLFFSFLFAATRRSRVETVFVPATLNRRRDSTPFTRCFNLGH